MDVFHLTVSTVSTLLGALAPLHKMRQGENHIPPGLESFLMCHTLTNRWNMWSAKTHSDVLPLYSWQIFFHVSQFEAEGINFPRI